MADNNVINEKMSSAISHFQESELANFSILLITKILKTLVNIFCLLMKNIVKKKQKRRKEEKKERVFGGRLLLLPLLNLFCFDIE